MKLLVITILTSILLLATAQTTQTYQGRYYPVVKIATDNVSCSAYMVLRWWGR